MAFQFLHRVLPCSALILGVLSGTSVAMAQEAPAATEAPPASAEVAEEAPVGDDDVTTLRLGVGALVSPDFEGAKDYGIYPLPVIEVSNWHKFNLSFRGLSYTLLQFENDAESEFKKVEFRLSPAISPSASRKGDGESLFSTRGSNKYLRGLTDVDVGVDVGADVFFRTGPVATQLVLRQEVAGGHEGFTAKLSLGTRIPFTPRTRLGMEVGTTWADDDYMDAFFSVDHREAWRSIYRPYEADAGFKDAFVGMRFDHDFTDRVGLLAALRYSRLMGDAADSPIVEGPGGSRDQFTFVLGLTYKWTFGG